MNTPEHYPLYSFTSAPTLAAGTFYHLVFTNIDPDPTVNFISVDLTYVFGAPLTPRQPKYDDENYAALRKFGAGTWGVVNGYTPILDLTYASGAHQGQGYMEVEVWHPAVISGSTDLVRERFTVSGADRVVSEASVRIARTSGAGDLFMRLEDSAGGLIDSCRVSAASVPVSSSGDNASGVWVTGSFAAPRTLASGAAYRLQLSSDAGTVLWTRGIQQGDSYGFAPVTYFADGLLEVSSDGGSTWSTVPGLAGSGDLQFFLR